MRAYVINLARWPCRVCRGRATVEVFYHNNTPIGFFCGTHGTMEAKRLNETEDAHDLRLKERRESP